MALPEGYECRLMADKGMGTWNSYYVGECDECDHIAVILMGRSLEDQSQSFHENS